MRFSEHARGDRREPLLELLAPLGWGMSLGQRLRAALYRHGVFAVHTPSVPVLSVGNLTFGGTNKTPVVAWLAERLQAAGRTVGIATRGYGRKESSPVLLRAGELVPEAGESARNQRGAGASSGPRAVLRDTAGDEPLMLSLRIPEAWVAVGRDRVASLDRLTRRGVDVVVLDDGFQHLRLARHLDLVLIDATSPFGNGRLLPAGSLREPVPALQRAGHVWVTRSETLSPEARRQLEARLLHWIPADRLEWAYSSLEMWGRVEFAPGPQIRWQPPEVPPGPVYTFSAIANPQSLLTLIEGAGQHPGGAGGTVIAGSRVFPDHHAISSSEFESVVAEARKCGARSVVCTEKDLQNLPPGGSDPPPPLWVPRLQVAPESADWFDRHVRAAIGP